MSGSLWLMSTFLWDWSFDGWIIVTGVLCSVSASLLGNFLVIRRMSLVGDAISHAVLPGIVAAYWLTGSANSLPMFVGAMLVGLLTVWLTEWTREMGRVDEGAATGVVFTGLFALGLMMVVQLANQVDLDLSCVLLGDIENTPLDTELWLGVDVPRSSIASGIVLVINLLFVSLFRRELQITSFDPQLAKSLGISPMVMHYSLASLVALTSVSSFESVGNILVVSMFVVPPATAWLVTKRMGSMVVLSGILAAASAIAGHWLAVAGPSWFGYGSTSTAAMITIVSAAFLALAILFGPSDGILVRVYRRGWLSTKILSEDILAALYRDDEQNRPRKALSEWRATMMSGSYRFSFALWGLRRRQLLELVDGFVQLTEEGRAVAQNLVRSHRLWEQYLVTEAGVDQQRIHQQAESLEHFTDRSLRDQLATETGSSLRDPHGRVIPPEGDSERTMEKR